MDLKCSCLQCQHLLDSQSSIHQLTGIVECQLCVVVVCCTHDKYNSSKCAECMTDCSSNQQVTCVSERLPASSHPTRRQLSLVLASTPSCKLQTVPVSSCRTYLRVLWRRLSICTRTLTAATIDAVRQLASRLLATGIWDQEETSDPASTDRHQGTMGGGKQKAILVTSFDENKVGAIAA